jgi:DNA-binding transcriptional LysR family regulator
MELRDLSYFEAVAEFQNVGKAAEYLHLSQPAVTGCLRRLEEMCGGPLVQKTGRGVRLTPAGEVLYEWAKRLRLYAQDATLEVQHIVHGLSGEVRIGLVATAAQFLLTRIAPLVLAEMPEVKVRIEVSTHALLAPMLRNGELDFLVVGESYRESGLVSRTIMEDCVVPTAVLTHAIFEHKRPTMRHLSEHRWILQPTTVLPRQWLDRAFDRAGLQRPYVQIETNMLNLQPELIVESGLLSFLPRRQLANSEALREIPVKEAAMSRRLELRHRENAYLSPVASRLIELLVEAGGIID